MLKKVQRVKVGDPSAIPLCVETLSRGGVILYPTDTVYGLGADATNSEAVRLVQKIKGRVESKAFLVMLPSIQAFEAYAVVHTTALELIKKFLPGPLSLVLEGREGVLDSVKNKDGSVGFRVPDNAFCQALSEAFGKPIVSTSANKSGETQPKKIEMIFKQLGNEVDGIGVVVEGEGKDNNVSPSTVVDARGEKAVVLREGAVDLALLRHFL